MVDGNTHGSNQAFRFFSPTFPSRHCPFYGCCSSRFDCTSRKFPVGNPHLCSARKGPLVRARFKLGSQSEIFSSGGRSTKGERERFRNISRRPRSVAKDESSGPNIVYFWHGSYIHPAVKRHIDHQAMAERKAYDRALQAEMGSGPKQWNVRKANCRIHGLRVGRLACRNGPSHLLAGWRSYS